MDKKTKENQAGWLKIDGVDYVSDKLSLDFQKGLQVIRDIPSWEVLLKWEWVYEKFGSGSDRFAFIWKPYSIGNVRFTDENTLESRSEIKVWEQIKIADDKRHKPLLFRAPNMFVYNLMQFVIVLVLLILIGWIVVYFTV